MNNLGGFHDRHEVNQHKSGEGVQEGHPSVAQWQACNGLVEYGLGTHSISLRYWSIESGSRVLAKAGVTDLLIIRADRDNYYHCRQTLHETFWSIQRL